MLDLIEPRVHTGSMPKGWLTTAEVARRLGLKQQQVRDMLRANKFKNAEQLPNRVWLIPETDLATVEMPTIGRPRKRRGRPPKKVN